MLRISVSAFFLARSEPLSPFSVVSRVLPSHRTTCYLCLLTFLYFTIYTSYPLSSRVFPPLPFYFYVLLLSPSLPSITRPWESFSRVTKLRIVHAFFLFTLYTLGRHFAKKFHVPSVATDPSSISFVLFPSSSQIELCSLRSCCVPLVVSFLQAVRPMQACTTRFYFVCAFVDSSRRVDEALTVSLG